MPVCVFCDPVYEEKVRAWCSGRGPAQRAQLQATPRASGPEDAIRGGSRRQWRLLVLYSVHEHRRPATGASWCDRH